jgi:ABC-type sugar transport system substrate-binding protein
MVTLVTVKRFGAGLSSLAEVTMKQLHFVVSLTTHDNDFQIEQAAAVEETARRLGVDAEILYADNDSAAQQRQILNLIHASTSVRPDGIIFEPVGGTSLLHAARAAVSAGIAWVILNRDADYLPELREGSPVPVFTVTSDHEEIGRIQGRQMEALLPDGGSVLYLTGPSDSLAAKQRTAGMHQTKPVEVQAKVMKGKWTEASGYRAISSWLRLSTSRQSRIDVVSAQNDIMAVGARKAFGELTQGEARERWLSLPYTGCDGLAATGKTWVQHNFLAATVMVPPNTGQAIELLTKAIRNGSMPPRCLLSVPVSYPEIAALRKVRPAVDSTLSASRG